MIPNTESSICKYHLFSASLDTCSKSGGLTYCQFNCNVSISNNAFNFQVATSQNNLTLILILCGDVHYIDSQVFYRNTLLQGRIYSTKNSPHTHAQNVEFLLFDLNHGRVSLKNCPKFSNVNVRKNTAEKINYILDSSNFTQMSSVHNKF